MAGLWRDRVRGGSATRKKPIIARPNEDSVLCRAADGLIGVFDGIGMYAQARMASTIARQRCTPLLRSVEGTKYKTLDESVMAVSQALLAAQDGVRELQKQFPQAGDGGTTAALAKLWQGEDQPQPIAIYVNIGDSRLYHWHHSDNELERLTTDDNIIRQWREYGFIDADTADAFSDLIDEYTGSELLPLEVQNAWEQRNTICAWLGMPDISFTLGTTALDLGDRIIAMSDGIHDNLTTDEITRIVRRKAEPREIAINLVDVAAAVAAVDISPRAKPDDMAVAVLILDH